MSSPLGWSGDGLAQGHKLLLAGGLVQEPAHTLVHVEVCDEVHWLRLRAISLSTGLRPVGGMIPGRSKDVTAEYARSPGTKA